MDCAFTVTWTRPFPGREKHALEFGAEVNAHWGKLAADGKCSEPEMFFFSDGHGFWMVKGDREGLMREAFDPASERLLIRGGLLLEGFAYDFATTGSRADEFMFRYAEEGATLGFM